MSRFLFLTALTAVTVSSSASAQLTSGESAARQYAESRAPRCCASCAARYQALLNSAPGCPGCRERHYLKLANGGVQAFGAYSTQSQFQNQVQPGPTRSQPPALGSSSTSGRANPYAFEQMINSYRTRRGLSPVRYNPALDGIAARNNVLQQQRNKCGHWYTGGLAQKRSQGSGQPRRSFSRLAELPRP